MKCKNTNFSRVVVFLGSPRPLPLLPRFPSPPFLRSLPFPRCQAPTPPPPAAANATKVRAALSPPAPARGRFPSRPRACPAPHPHVTHPRQWACRARGPGSGSAREMMDTAVQPQAEGGSWLFGPPTPQLWIPLGIPGPSGVRSSRIP